MTIDTDTLVNREVHYCISYLVSTLAKHSYNETGDLLGLCEQACELFMPIPDYDEALLQEGIEEYLDEYGVTCWKDNEGNSMAGTAQEACDFFDIEPYDREISSHWIVSNWLADRLESHGEKIDRDFGGMVVWARTSGNQGISMDSVIEKITNDLNAR